MIINQINDYILEKSGFGYCWINSSRDVILSNKKILKFFDCEEKDLVNKLIQLDVNKDRSISGISGENEINLPHDLLSRK